MSERKKERWRELCEQAAIEQDPQKLHQFVKEIVCVLDAKEQQSQQPSPSTDSRTQTSGHFGSTH